jgi:hypothetical protein
MKSTKYQVFLSSTYSDLKEERESIIKAILELYHIPIGMEMFSAEDEDQWEIIRRTIEVSDYYILVLGLRYGSKTSDGTSFTQKEYEYALEKKIPILTFIMDENMPMSKYKRDDDLSEITKFRESVLINSKMAQFWKTKDELAKQVSIALINQIKKKPSIGWVRGDKDEELSKKIAILNKENRELRENITELESRVSLKVPDLELNIKPPVVDEKFYSYKKIEMPNVINFDKIDTNLLEYISEEDINKYNNSLPSQHELDKHNNESERIYRIKNYSIPLVIDIANRGSSKANGLHIDIKFPEGLFVYENDKQYSYPKSPIPFNPLIHAQTEYDKKLKETKGQGLSLSELLAQNQFNLFTTIKQSSINFADIYSTNQNCAINLDENKITIEIGTLLHKTHKRFDDKYMIVPLKSGKHAIKVEIICEEYEDIKTQLIEFNI